MYIPGKVDEAITFYGTSSYIRWREPLKTSFTNAITAAMWFKNKQAPTANTTLMVLDHAAALYWKTAGGLTFSVTDSSGQTFEVSSNLALTDTNWHHVVGAWDGTTISIYIDSVLAGSYVPAGMGLLDTSSSQLTLANSVAGVNGYVGYIDEFLLFPRGFTDQEAANLYGLGMRAWKYAVLDDYSAPITPWTYTLPAGLEGLYEIDLRGIDDWDNRDDHPAGWNAWQGEIDMLAPRVSLNAVNQGATTEVQCSSTDFNLSRDNYQCPCTTLQSDLTTYDQVNNWYKEVLIDQTRLYKIMSKCSVPAGTPLQMQACDIYGRCSTASATASSEPDWKEAGAFTLVTPEMLLQGPPSPIDSPPEPGEVKPAPQPSLLPVSRLIDPPDGSQVSSRQPLTLTLQADAISALQLITVTLDGGLLTSLSFPDPVVTSTLTTIPWTPDPNLAAGAHVLQASALDWVGQTQAEFFPVTLFFDSQSPPADVHPNQAPEPAAAQSNLPPTSALLEPPDHSVLPNLDPLDLKVGAEGLNGLKAITVTLDGGWLSTISLPNDPITRTLVTIPWTPDPTLADGAHLFQTNALDWAGLAQTQLFTSTLFVDTQVPSIDISPTVLTTTQQIANWAVNLGGPVGDLAGIKSVEVALQDGTGALTPAPGPPGAQGNPWNAAAVVGDRWSYPYRTDTLPDGQVINVVVQATDLAGHIQQAVRPVTLDLVPPTPITMTVSYANSQGIVTQVLPGQTILDVMNPTLLIEWTPASDGSGLRTYYAGLSQDDSPDLANLATVNPVGPLQYSQATSEVQAYTAFVVSEDIYGNRSWNRLGPIYVDTPLTPDLIALPSTADNGDIYHGWMDSGDSQIGINRIIAENVPPGFSLNGDQKFYLSWDATALRLAWLGADWNSEGDLYIYMKTGTGMGSNQAYNPFTATFSDTLTLPMAADTLLWVTDSQSAHLMRWNGAAWFDALPGGLGPEYFRFTARSPRSVTDLYLPFALLGIANPGTTPLDLIAFGSQEQALRLWTVFPITNPHNSPILSKLLLLLPDQHHLVMNHAYHWPDLALGQSPNRSVYLDVDVRSLIVADPTGVISDTRQSGLYLSSLFHLPTESPLIGDGQVINYTLNYINIGGASAPNEHLILRITSAGPLVLPGGTKIIRPDGSEGYVREIDLGPILPGSRGTTQFTGLVNVSPLQAKYQICLKNHPGNPQDCQQLYDLLHTARIDAYLSTTHANGMIINTFSVKHSLAVDPPVGVAILSAQGDLSPVLDAANQEELSGIPPQVLKDAQTFPPIFVRSGINTLNGSAYDPSGVAGVTVQILDPDGDTTDTHCNVSAPKSGLWSCAVSLPQAPNDTRYFARARASNPFGYTSDWSRWRVLLIELAAAHRHPGRRKPVGVDCRGHRPSKDET